MVNDYFWEIMTAHIIINISNHNGNPYCEYMCLLEWEIL